VFSLGFFQTPQSIAEAVADNAFEHLAKDTGTLVDACAGNGALGLAAVQRHRYRISQIHLIEIQGKLLRQARLRLARNGCRPLLLHHDVFDPFVDAALAEADVLLCNPPFLSYRHWSAQEDAIRRRYGLPHYNDLACSIVLRICAAVTTGAVLTFILRNDTVQSRGYRAFQEKLDSYCDRLKVLPLGRTLKKNSGAAASSIIVLRRVEAGRIAKVGCQRRWEAAPKPNWPALSEIATVKAGPSISRQILLSSRVSEGIPVVQVPRRYDGAPLWHTSFVTHMKWSKELFSAARNLWAQGRPGVVYQLAGSRFRTLLLPANFHFLSGTPAIQPHNNQDLNFITGCAYLPQWRGLVRELIRSTNFTPLAVAAVPVPYGIDGLHDVLEELGRSVRVTIEDALRLDGFVSYLPTSIKQKLSRAMSAWDDIGIEYLGHCADGQR
jgi:hypothetical protein